MEREDLIKKRFFYILCAVFIAVNAIFIAKEFYYFSFLPLLLFLGYWFFFSIDKFILLIVFCTPLSVKLEDLDINVGVSIPTEPLMFAVLLIFLVKVIYDGQLFDKKLLKHPITIAVIFNLFWMLTTSITSVQPVVSFKYLTARLWFVSTFFFFGLLLFKEIKNIKLFVWVYCIPLAGVIIYNTINHAAYGFDRQVGTWIVHPFFNDHTAYGSTIALMLPFIFSFIFDSSITKTKRIVALCLTAVLITGVMFSYSRAAWLSLAGVLGVFLVLKLKINFKFVFAIFLILLGLFFMFRTEIIMEMEKNKQDSSEKYSEHIQSIANISTDASNLERINRWASAIRMFKERPVFGWGPGTYQLVYAPFQFSKEKTIISTNAGDMGNAHSEYIGPLSESGVFGMLSVIFVVVATLFTSVRAYKKGLNKNIKMITLGAMLGLCTYYIHGLMNNFLDTDKASVPFWSFTAMILIIDVFYTKPTEKEI